MAAGRAGAMGVLDLAGVGPEIAAEALVRAGRFAAHPFALRLEAGTAAGLLGGKLPEKLAAIVCAGGDGTDWGTALDLIRRAGCAPLAEVASREAAARAMAAGAEGVIASGHEAGGIGAEESSFVLLQGLLAEGIGPVWVRGGIGMQSAAACVAAGAAGVVLDGAVLLAREAGLGEEAREQIARFDGGETIAIGPEGGPAVRVFCPPGSPVAARLQEAAEAGGDRWRAAIAEEVGWEQGRAWPVGQDSAFAAGLARRYVTVGGIVRAVEEAIDRGRDLASKLRPLAPGSPLAQSHGTRYPIVQGPMTRVSDTAAFASAVADGGALPLLALALMRGPEVRTLLADAKVRLGARPWGVGILGFAPPELRAEQYEAILAARPPFALIAGGRPDQARGLEALGIATYLHAPSPGLLSQYVRDGARRFVLEGRECGGHVGPRSSLILWEQAVGVLMEALEKGQIADPGELHVLFAGGIHDAPSSAAVSALAAPLAARGAKVGVLVGTAYLFTREAVSTGAIVPQFQAEAVRCRQTSLLKTGPGHEVRVAPSAFSEAFEAERRRLVAAGAPAEQIREELERLNAGRLRVAAKGVERSNGAGSPLVALDEAGQAERGLYMIGQVAALRDRVTTIAELHRDLSEAGTDLLGRPDRAADRKRARTKPSDIAIVGMSAIFPGAADVRTFWENTLKGIDAITEVPPDRWDWRPYYDADPKAPDKITSKWGGFIPDVPFDPLRYGMPPTSLPSIEPAQLLMLEAVRAALDDAGYAERPFARERTAVVLGMGGGAAQLAMGYAFRSYLPMLESADPEAGKQARRHAEALLPEWTEDSFPGFLLNVTAGRVANRFDLGGANYTVDAACGSSLAAAALAVRELETGAADVVVLGGADTVQNPFTYLAFSKTQAFSPRGRCRPFDASADGIVISEGVGVVVLKRLADAERDGDRIYAVIKGVGSSSDGRDRGLTAPNGAGQARALDRAYAKAGVDPKTLGYVEAHGTGTAVGDVVEVNALAKFLRSSGMDPSSCVVGSVKSMIGHTKCAAGLAGLINASLALHHRVLPPTIGVERLNPKADLHDGPLQVGTKARPWLHSADRPRHAGVSAFGFGGTNFHAVLEAYEGDPAPRPSSYREWPAELLAWQAPDCEGLLAKLDRLATQLEAGAAPRLRDLAHSLAANLDHSGGPRPTLAIVAASLDDLRAKLKTAREAIAKGERAVSDPSGLYYAEAPEFRGADVAFLFPGQGAQALEMLGDLSLAFEEVRGGYESFDAALAVSGLRPIGPKVFPPTTLDDAGRERARLELTATDVAQPAVGAASVGMLRLLGSLGLKPSAVAGHSYGELVALYAAGAIAVEDLAVLSEARGRLMLEAAGTKDGAMAALAAGPDLVEPLIRGIEGVSAVNFNGPRQTVLAGDRDALARAVEAARVEGIRTFELQVSCAFHSSHVAGARKPLARLASELIVTSPAIPVFSNVDALPHPAQPGAIARRLGDHLASPVQFAPMIEAMHSAGARIFVECGPGAVLTPLVGSILGDRPHLAVSCNAQGRPGIPTLLHALARLIAAGAALPQLTRLTADRGARRIDPDRLPAGPEAPLSPSTWLVNGSRARPIAGPEPRRLGQAPELLGPPLSPKPDVVAEAPARVEPPSLPARNGHAAEPASRNGHGHAHAQSHMNGSTRPEMSPISPRPAPASSHDHGRNGHAAAPQAPTHAAGSARVIEAFQETMLAFLEVQQATMLAYLTGQPGAQAMPAPPAYPPASTGMNGNGFAHSAPQPHAEYPTAVAPAPQPPAAPVAPPPEPVPAAAPGPELRSPETVSERLVEIVRQRTGYPAEMLNLDLDLEADLGIDSIKRVEILGTLRDTVAGLKDVGGSGLMDSLTRAKTLGEIVKLVEGALAKQAPTPRPAEPPRANGKPSPAVTPAPSDPGLRRLVLDVADAPLPSARKRLAPGGTILLTDDGGGVARGLAGRLQSDGHAVELIGPGRVDLSSPASVEEYVRRVSKDRAIAGIVHALPLREGPAVGLDPAAWGGRLGPELRGLFLLARAAADDLERSAKRGGACLIAATALGGAFGSTPRGIDAPFPGQGGIAGLVKTLAREWPGVRARVVDLDPDEAAASRAARLAAEIHADDGWAEVGYDGGRRIRLKASERPLTRSGGASLELRPGQPVLITGGARGITAAVAVELAKLWKPTLLLVGSSPMPEEREDSATLGLEATSDLKSALLEQARRSGRSIGPAELEQAYRSLRRAREIRSALLRMREAGAVVEYASADVRDAAALARALEPWRARYGDPAGLIHGAGVIHDKLLRDKTPESFDRVLGTKLDGALNLAGLLNPEALRFSALFSSVAGRFGNQGQSDYAAANEVLNKLAIWLDRRWSGRVVSVNWGPWAGVGMVSDLEEHLGRRGLGMIPPEAGCAALVDELRFGRKGEVEVVIAGDLGGLDGPLPARGEPAELAGSAR